MIERLITENFHLSSGIEKSYLAHLMESTYDLDFIFSSLQSKGFNFNKQYDAIKQNKINDIKKLAYYDDIEIQDNEVAAVQFDLNFLIPILHKYLDLDYFVIDTLSLLWDISQDPRVKGALGTEYSANKRKGQIVLNPSAIKNLNHLKTIIGHELVHLLDFLRSNGKSNRKGNHNDDWTIQDIKKYLSTYNYKLKDGTIKKETPYETINRLYFTDSEVNARIHDLKQTLLTLKIDPVKNPSIDIEYIIGKIESLENVFDFYNILVNYQGINKEKLKSMMRSFLIRFSKRAHREGLLSDKQLNDLLGLI